MMNPLERFQGRGRGNNLSFELVYPLYPAGSDQVFSLLGNPLANYLPPLLGDHGKRWSGSTPSVPSPLTNFIGMPSVDPQ